MARLPGAAALAGQPLVLEQQAPVRHQHAFDAHHHLVPVIAGRGRPELIGGTGAADIGTALVDHQQLAVIAVQVVQPPAPAQRVVLAQLHPGHGQALTRGTAETQAAEAVEQAADLDPTAGGGAQRLHQRRRAQPILHQIQLEQHQALGRVDVGEHGRHEGRTIHQQLEAVGRLPGEDGAAHREVKIITAPTGTDRLMLDNLATLRSASTPSSRPKCSACSTSGARVTTWKRRSSRRVASSSAM